MQLSLVLYKIIAAIAVFIFASVIFPYAVIAAENASKTISASANTIIVKPETNTAPVKLIIEASISNIVPTPKPTKDDLIETWTKGTNNNAEFVIAITKLIVSGIMLIATLFLVLYLANLAYTEMTQNSIIMELFDVPEELVKEGYTGKSIAHQLLDKFEYIRRRSNISQIIDEKSVINSSKKGNMELPWRQEAPEISVGNFSLKSLKFLFSPFKKLTCHSTIYISGELQYLDKQYKIIARCEDDIEKIVYTSKTPVDKSDIQDELLLVAETLYEKLYQEIIGFYFLKTNRQNKGENIINKLLEHKKLSKNDKIAIYLNFGDYLSDVSRYEDAIEKYKKVIELNPNEYLAYNNWGIVLEQQKKYDEAIENFQKVIKINSNYYLAYYNLGVSLGKQGKYKDAIEQYQKAIKLNPNDDYAYTNLGVVFAESNEYEKAIENFEKAIKLNPNDDLAHNNLAMGLHRLNKTQEALPVIKYIIKRTPNESIFYDTYGDILKTLGKYKEAKEAFENVIMYANKEQQDLVERAKKEIQELEELLKNKK